MNIIAGKKRGMILQSPEGMKTRPMNARVKEAMFNILGDHVENALVLDLFSGSGGLGLEALSRGGQKCYFVENGRHALPVLEANINKADFRAQSKILRLDAFTIERVDLPEKISLFFMDPPYRYIDEPVLRRQTLDFMARVVAKYGEQQFWLVLHFRRGAMAGMPLPAIFKVGDQRSYGSTELLFLCSHLQ